MFIFKCAIVFLFPTAAITNRFEFSPQMKALALHIGCEASIHHHTHTQVQHKYLPLSGAQKCHGFPLLSSHPLTQ